MSTSWIWSWLVKSCLTSCTAFIYSLLHKAKVVVWTFSDLNLCFVLMVHYSETLPAGIDYQCSLSHWVHRLQSTAVRYYLRILLKLLLVGLWKHAISWKGTSKVSKLTINRGMAGPGVQNAKTQHDEKFSNEQNVYFSP